MQPHTRIYTPASLPALRWLTGSRRPMRWAIQQRLLGELFTSRTAVLMGVLNSLVLNMTALALCHQIMFVVLMGIDLSLAGVRLLVLHRAAQAAVRQRPTPTDAYLATAILWSALQGALALACWHTGSHVLQVLSAATILGLLGPLCARNYPAPRLAMLLVGLCDLPFVLGGAFSGDPWMLILLLQTPLYLFGCLSIITRFRSLAVTTLQAEHDSRQRAHHDPLTGLLNRLGFAEAIDRMVGEAPPRFAVFYLDLDGFKTINDTLGHHAGDLLLQTAARRLLAIARRNDVSARLGGDEFIIVTRNMLPEEADEFSLRMVNSVTAHPYSLGGGHPVRIGASVGFACAPDDGVELDELCRKADIALYDAKAAGRGVRRRFAA